MTDPVPALDKQTTANNRTGTALTAYLCALLTYLTWALVSGVVQPTFRDVVVGLVGFITAKLSTVFDWHYGTSSANKKAVDTIAVQAATAAKAQEALAPVPGAAPTIPVAPGDKVVVEGTGDKVAP